MTSKPPDLAQQLVGSCAGDCVAETSFNLLPMLSFTSAFIGSSMPSFHRLQSPAEGFHEGAAPLHWLRLAGATDADAGGHRLVQIIKRGKHCAERLQLEPVRGGITAMYTTENTASSSTVTAVGEKASAFFQLAEPAADFTNWSFGEIAEG